MNKQDKGNLERNPAAKVWREEFPSLECQPAQALRQMELF